MFKRWILCSKKLPRKEGWYLVIYFMSEHGFQDINVSWFDKDLGQFNAWHEEVVAWKQLPRLPRDVKLKLEKSQEE